MADNPGHVQREHDPPPGFLLIKKSGIDADLFGIQEIFHQIKQLSEQIFLVSLPARFHFFEHIHRGPENNPLQPEFVFQFKQIDLGDFAPIRLAVYSGGQFRQLRGIAGIEHQ